MLQAGASIHVQEVGNSAQIIASVDGANVSHKPFAHLLAAGFLGATHSAQAM